MNPAAPSTPVYVADFAAKSASKQKYILHPKPLGSLVFLVTYFALLWRSTSKPDSTRIIIPRESFLTLVTEAHKALLKYVTSKAVRLLTIILLIFKRVFGNVLQGPAAIAAEFLSKQGVAFQDTVQSKFEEFLEGQMEFLGEKTKETVGDPYMPKFIHDMVDDVIDSLVPDAKRLVLTKTDELIRYRSPVTRHLIVGNAVVLGSEIGPARARRKKAEAEAAKKAETFNPWALASSAREQALEFVTLPYRWYYETTLDKQTDAILDEIAAEPANEDEDDDNDSEAETVEDKSWRAVPAQIRAKILHVSSPCDKSIWQCLRDYRWLIVTALGLLPYGIGTIWWLFMFALHDKRDEYQICNFIVGFMVSKFLGGCGLLMYGAFKYYICSTKDIITCAEDGPRVFEYYDGILFFAQTLLVWLCFFILPMTHPCRSVRDERDAYLVEDMERVHTKLGSNRPRGGRLVELFWWDSFCVFFVLMLALFAWGVAGQEGWQLRATLFWLKALFGLLSLPFLLFKIPVLNTLLMQVRPTGYDEKGRVVLHTRVRPPIIDSSNVSKTTGNSPDVSGTRLDRQPSLDDVLAPLSDDEDMQLKEEENLNRKLSSGSEESEEEPVVRILK
jgi:hypothetical protein